MMMVMMFSSNISAHDDAGSLVLRISIVDTRGCRRSPSDATVLEEGVRCFVPNLFVTSM